IENRTELVHKLTELEAISKNEVENWYKTEEAFQNFMDFHVQVLQELVQTVESSVHALKVFENYGVDITDLGGRFNSDKSKERCRSCLVESRWLFTQNCRLYNEFLVSKDPSVHTDDGHRLFKFDKVYDQQATKEEVFLDTQPVIKSVIDGYNVCIFTLGQSGWEKTNKHTLGI
ncbi:hypothetical protein MKX03_027474, partial [Papaver bracteatum]